MNKKDRIEELKTKIDIEKVNSTLFQKKEENLSNKVTGHIILAFVGFLGGLALNPYVTLASLIYLCAVVIPSGIITLKYYMEMDKSEALIKKYSEELQTLEESLVEELKENKIPTPEQKTIIKENKQVISKTVKENKNIKK